MPSKKVVFLFCVFVSGSCSSQTLQYTKPMHTKSGVHIFDKKLAVAFSDLDKTMAVSRSPVQLQPDITASNCKDYLAHISNHPIVEGAANFMVASEYLTCAAVGMLIKATPQLTARYHPQSYGQELYARLDLSSFPTSFGPRLDPQHQTFKSFGNTSFHTAKYALVYDTADWHLSLRVVATADVDGNGQADWLVWLTDEAKTGNYRGYNQVIILNPTREGLLRAGK